MSRFCASQVSLESAKFAGIEPAAYLAEATRRAIEKPGMVTLPSDLANA